MNLYRNLEDVPARLQGGAVSIGNFDGVHRGHARIVERLCERAREVGGPAVVFTFDPHPIQLLRPAAAPPPLTWTERKAELLGTLGVDAVISYPTDRAFLSLSPREFFDRIVRERLAARAVIEGPNFEFGAGRSGTIDTLRDLCHAASLTLDVVEPLLDGDSFVSSSRIRGLIRAGDVAEAARLCLQPHRIRGHVTRGAGRGQSIGFATANLAGVDTLLPQPGVYAGRAILESGAVFLAAINIGPNPTFGESELKIEAHLLDYQESLYGQTIELDFLKRLRAIRPFGSVAELREQLQQDVAATRQLGASREGRA